MRIVLDEGAKMPTRAHTWDAGLDLYSMCSRRIDDYEGVVFDT